MVTGLWDGWDADAFVQDKQSSIFFDESKLHVLNHVGKHFSVRGPLSVRRSPQGRPILVQAGTSEVGQQIAARHCDIVFAAQQSMKGAQSYYNSVKGRLASYGRSEEDLLMMVGLTPIVGRTREEAQEKYSQLEELVDPLVGLSILKRSFGDLSHLDLDGPVPAPDLENAGIRSSANMYYETAKRENLSIRQLYKRIAMAQEHLTVIGTGSDVADAMEEWIESKAADGFNITPTHLPHGLNDFVQHVLPELHRRGRFRKEYEGQTLRQNLGLREPQSVYASTATV